MAQIPGARTFLLEARRRGLPTSIATSSGMPRPFLTAAGLEDLVTTLVDRTQVAAAKPAPDLFLEAARRLGVPPQACLVVEDAAVGIQAARAGGCQVAALTTTECAADLADADVVVDRLSDIWAWIDRG